MVILSSLLFHGGLQVHLEIDSFRQLPKIDPNFSITSSINPFPVFLVCFRSFISRFMLNLFHLKCINTTPRHLNTFYSFFLFHTRHPFSATFTSLKFRFLLHPAHFITARCLTSLALRHSAQSCTLAAAPPSLPFNTLSVYKAVSSVFGESDTCSIGCGHALLSTNNTNLTVSVRIIQPITAAGK